MKYYTLGLFAIILAISISSFQTSNNLKKNKIYYAVKDGSSFIWTQTMPDPDLYDCVNSTVGYCHMDVADNFAPTNGQEPAAQDIISHPSHHSIHELIP